LQASKDEAVSLENEAMVCRQRKRQAFRGPDLDKTSPFSLGFATFIGRGMFATEQRDVNQFVLLLKR